MLLYTLDKVLVVTTYLKGDTTTQFKLIIYKYLEYKGLIGYLDKTKKLISKYKEFKKALKENFSNPNKEYKYKCQLG